MMDSSSITTPARPVWAAEPDSHEGETEIGALRAKVSELQRERDRLVAVVDILNDVNAAPHFVDILQTVVRKLGETFGLDRCSVYLTGESDEVRLVATFEDASVRNLVVDLDRYPELKQAFRSGETVFIADAANDPLLRQAKAALDRRNVRSIVVVPIRSRGAVIGAIFLRTEREAAPILEADVRFCQVVASLTANALRSAHRVETLERRAADPGPDARREAALISFMGRLLRRHEVARDGATLPFVGGNDDELDRLVGVAMQVLEAKANS